MRLTALIVAAVAALASACGSDVQLDRLGRNQRPVLDWYTADDKHGHAREVRSQRRCLG